MTPLKRKYLSALLSLASLLPGACTGMPDGVTPVRDFEISRYLGTWHEIARLDHSFERGLVAVTADYSLNPDGSVRVVNRGYDPAACRWRQAVGRAIFVEDPRTAHLAVSFFGPFYGGYTVFALAPDYAWATVSGPSHGYLWVLSRSPEMPDDLYRRLTEDARARGFATDGLIRLKTPPPECEQPPGGAARSPVSG